MVYMFFLLGMIFDFFNLGEQWNMFYVMDWRGQFFIFVFLFFIFVVFEVSWMQKMRNQWRDSGYGIELFFFFVVGKDKQKSLVYFMFMVDIFIGLLMDKKIFVLIFYGCIVLRVYMLFLLLNMVMVLEKSKKRSSGGMRVNLMVLLQVVVEQFGVVVVGGLG